MIDNFIIIPDNYESPEVGIPTNKNYDCGDSSGYFLISNLFSELVDEYQRSKARKNLGIENTSGGQTKEYNIFYGTDELYLNFSNTPKLTIDAGSDSYIYIALDDPNLHIYVNGMCGGFYEHNIAQINGTDYIIYKSVYPNLGLTNIEIR